MYERFTDRARKSMQIANQEACRLRHEYIGTEHILLGVMGTDGVAANAMASLGLNYEMLRMEIMQLVQSGPDMVTMRQLPQTPRAKRVIECAMKEARTLNHNYVGTEHLLIGLMSTNPEETIACKSVLNCGVSPQDVINAVHKFLGVRKRGGEKMSEPFRSALDPTGLRGFQPGDVVCLKSGGPKMTVSKQENEYFICVWFCEQEENGLRKSQFLEETLRRVE